MARSKKGRDISGWIIIDKPAGMTSTSVVNKIRWAFEAKKAGHSGTLDPAATGLLAIALGEATKTIPYVTDAMKAYRFTVTFGAATNTDDAEGEVIATATQRPTDREITLALPQFTGDILQVPPQFSAVKIDGERAYHRARQGDELDLAARPLFVEDLTLIDRPDADHAVLEMTCGKGGYVRAIARDLGVALGCQAHVQTLCRLWSGPFDLDQATGLETIEDRARTPEIDELLLPLEDGLTELPELPCRPEAAQRLRHGNPAPVIASTAEYGDEAWASLEGRAVAVGTYRAGNLHPTRVFAA